MAPTGPLDSDRRSVLKATGALGAFFGSSGLASATEDDSESSRSELLIGVSPSTSDAEATVASALGTGDVVHSNETLHYVTVELPANTPEEAKEQIEATLDGIDAIEYVEENATLEAYTTPNDPYYSSQQAPQQVNCSGAWDETLGDSDVVISVVDQGIAYDHENLEANMDDRTGAVFVGRGSDPYPVNSNETHGTIVAGIAGGETDNGIGHAGISDCSMLSARALNEHSSGSLADIADAIQWSADQGADVINLSLGSRSHWQTLANACRYAVDQGSLPVAAAGNEGSTVSYPAAYDSVLAVSAIDSNDRLASFSNRGPEIDLAAPGSNVLSTTLNDGYTRASGTSMAAPVVAGVAGLVLSVYPDLSPEELRQHLEATATNIGLSANHQGHGRVDAAAAVTTVPDGHEPRDGDNGDENEDEDDSNEDEENDNGGDDEPDDDTFEYAVEAHEDDVEYFLEGVEGVDFTPQAESETVYVSDDGTRAAGLLIDGERHAFDGLLVDESVMLDADVRGDGTAFIDGEESALGWYPRSGASGDDWKDIDELLDLEDDESVDDDSEDDEPEDDEPEGDEPEDDEPEDDEPEDDEPEDDEPEGDEPEDDEPENDEPEDDEPEDDEPEDETPDDSDDDDDSGDDDPLDAWRRGDISFSELMDALRSQ
ncbi:S8 family serine peptidase [Natrarchaeobaculum sulfurireducens]